MHVDNMIHIDSFLPYIEPEAPTVPVPILRRLIREALIESCEEAPIWRWDHPEIPTRDGVLDYDLTPLTEDTRIHSIKKLYANCRELRNVDEQCDLKGISSGDFEVKNRGHIRLARSVKASDPVASATGGAGAGGLTPPVDPGPVQTSFPLEMPKFDPPQYEIHGNGHGSLPWYGLQRVGIPPVASEDIRADYIILVDFSNYDAVNHVSNLSADVLLGEPDPDPVVGSVHSVYYSSYDVVETALHGDTSTANLKIGDVVQAVANGTPWLAIRWKSGSFWYCVSGWLASPDDADDYVTFPIANTAVEPAYSGDAETSVTFLPIPGNATARFLVFDEGAEYRVGFNTASTYDALHSAYWFTEMQNNPLNSIFIMNFLNYNGNPVNSIREFDVGIKPAFLQFEDYDGSMAEYDLRFYPDPTRDAEAANTINIDELYLNGSQSSSRHMLLLAAQPDGASRGLIYVVDRSGNYTQFPDVRLAPPELQGAVVGGTTQADVDQYLLDLAAYNAALAAAGGSSSDSRIKGLEACVTLKPTETTNIVPEYMLYDYRDLVVTGTMYRLFAMRDVEWYNLGVSKAHEENYRVHLGKARAANERGFTTKSLKIRGRKF